jgi:hypothetical protein
MRGPARAARRTRTRIRLAGICIYMLGRRHSTVTAGRTIGGSGGSWLERSRLGDNRDRRLSTNARSLVIRRRAADQVRYRARSLSGPQESVNSITSRGSRSKRAKPPEPAGRLGRRERRAGGDDRSATRRKSGGSPLAPANEPMNRCPPDEGRRAFCPPGSRRTPNLKIRSRNDRSHGGRDRPATRRPGSWRGRQDQER